jgi:Flp pilus assembly protein TadG
MLKNIIRFFRAARATAAIEFALISPVILLLIAGVVEFGNIFQIYTSVNRLASQYAIAWADCSDTSGSCSSAGELANYTSTNTITNIFPQLSNFSSQGQLRMFQVAMTAGVPAIATPSSSPAGVYEYPAVAVLSAAEIAASQNLCPQPVSASTCTGQSGVIVTASYSYTPFYFPTLMNQFLQGHITPSYTVAQLKS